MTVCVSAEPCRPAAFVVVGQAAVGPIAWYDGDPALTIPFVYDFNGNAERAAATLRTPLGTSVNWGEVLSSAHGCLQVRSGAVGEVSYGW